jgi:hypothetical protein
LAENPGIVPAELTKRFAAGDIIRLSGGTYGVLVDSSKGKPVLLLNGFHPEQVETFEDPQAAVILMQGRSPESWHVLREHMIGATDPSKARAGSIRNVLLEQEQEYGVAPVTSLRNGVHMSAGPVEAAVEISRFLLPDSTSSRGGIRATTFGSALSEIVSPGLLAALESNSEIRVEGKGAGSAFDLTEELDAEACLFQFERGEVSLNVER